MDEIEIKIHWFRDDDLATYWIASIDETPICIRGNRGDVMDSIKMLDFKSIERCGKLTDSNILDKIGIGHSR